MLPMASAWDTIQRAMSCPAPRPAWRLSTTTSSHPFAIIFSYIILYVSLKCTKECHSGSHDILFHDCIRYLVSAQVGDGQISAQMGMSRNSFLFYSKISRLLDTLYTVSLYWEQSTRKNQRVEKKIRRKHDDINIVEQPSRMGLLSSAFVHVVIATVLLGALKRAGIVRYVLTMMIGL